MQPNLDIVILADDGAYYKLPSSVWMKPENKIPADFAGDAKVLVKRGALLADVPQPTFPSGYYCILLNLSEVEGVTAVPNQSADGIKKSAVEIGVEGLVIHVPENQVPDGAYYVVSEQVWRGLKIDKASVPVSSHLAASGALCAETTEGFLVNLDRIGP